MKRLAWLFPFLLLVGLLACTPTTPTPTPVPPTPTPTPQDWLDQAVTAWNQSKSFHFTLELEGRTIALDETGLLSFSRAEGDLQAPDRLQAQTVIKSPLGTSELLFIAIGEQQWLTNPLSGAWEEAPPGMQTDVDSLFDPEIGIGPTLAAMEGLERLPDETLENEATVRLRGQLEGAALATVAPDLADQESVEVELWIGEADRRIRQIVIREPGEGGVGPTWTFQFSNFDVPVEIEPPL